SPRREASRRQMQRGQQSDLGVVASSFQRGKHPACVFQIPRHMSNPVILRLETNDDRLGGSEYEHSWLRLISVERLRLAGRAGRPARHTARRDAEQSTRDACAPRTIAFISEVKNPARCAYAITLLDSSLRSE